MKWKKMKNIVKEIELLFINYKNLFKDLENNFNSFKENIMKRRSLTSVFPCRRSWRPRTASRSRLRKSTSLVTCCSIWSWTMIPGMSLAICAVWQGSSVRESKISVEIGIILFFLLKIFFLKIKKIFLTFFFFYFLIHIFYDDDNNNENLNHFYFFLSFIFFGMSSY